MIYRLCCCRLCRGGVGIEMTLTGLNANRCTPCFPEGILSVAWDVSSLLMDGTYTLPPLGTPSANYLFGAFNVACTSCAHVKEYGYSGGACGALLEESDSQSMTISVVVDCDDLNDAGQPRIKVIAVTVAFPSSFPAFGTAPTSVFGYSSMANGGSYYVGDGQAIPNGSGAVCQGGSTLTIGGHASVRPLP